MGDFLKHKGYLGSVEFSHEDDCLVGKVQFINDLIMYEGECLLEIKSSFQSAVDEYLDYCRQEGIEPNKPFKGSLNVRLGEELHRKCAQQALVSGRSLNQFIVEAAESHVAAVIESL